MIVGIDPDVAKSGVSVLVRESREIKLDTLSLVELLEHLTVTRDRVVGEGKKMVVVVEAGWLVSKSNYHGVFGHRGQKLAKNVGANHQIGKNIVELLRYNGMEVVEKHPLRKCWQGREGKITHQELAYFIPGLPKHTNQEERDAALLAWEYANLPIKAKINV